MRKAATLAAAGLFATNGAALEHQAPVVPIPAALEVVARAQSDPLRGPVLDLVLLDDERLLVLLPEALTLYRWSARGLALEARQDLPGPLASVRHPGGLLLADTGESTVWVATSVAALAVLYEIEGTRLVERARADAMPWKDAPLGLRYRTGSDWIEGPLPRLGSGPFLAVEPSLDGLAVSTSGELLAASGEGPASTGLAAGPALAALWPPLFAATSAAPPQTSDRVLVFERAGDEVHAGPVLPMLFEGAVRALAARHVSGHARLIVAVEDSSGATRLERLDVREAGSQP